MMFHFHGISRWALLSGILVMAAMAEDPFQAFSTSPRALSLGGTLATGDGGPDALGGNPALIFTERTLSFGMGTLLAGVETAPYEAVRFFSTWHVAPGTAVGVSILNLSVGDLLLSGTTAATSHWELFTTTGALAKRWALTPDLVIQAGVSARLRISSDSALLPLDSAALTAGAQVQFLRHYRVAFTAQGDIPLTSGSTNTVPLLFTGGISRSIPMEKFLASTLTLGLSGSGETEALGASAEWFFGGRLLRLAAAVTYPFPTALPLFTTGAGLEIDLVQKSITVSLDWGARLSQDQWTHGLQARIGMSL